MLSTLRLSKVPSVLALLLVVAACNNPFCTRGGDAGIVLTVEDALTGQRPEGAFQISLRSNAGSYEENHSVPPGSGAYELPLAVDRPGEYSITIEASGYETWTRANVNVPRASGCRDVETTRLTAELTQVPVVFSPMRSQLNS